LRKALQSADLAAGGLDDHEGLRIESRLSQIQLE